MGRFVARRFRRRWWMVSRHAETLAALAEKTQLPYQNDVVKTTDGDDILLSWLEGDKNKPLLTLFHGLEGCAQSHTVRTIAKYFHSLKWTVAVPHFRSCGRMNRLPRAYHAADGNEVEWMLKYCNAAFPHTLSFAAGVSLGGNALIHGIRKDANLSAAAVVSAPLNLPDAAKQLSSGITHAIYGKYFVRLLTQKIRDKMKHYPALLNEKTINKIHTIRDFDAAYTAPIHGFKNENDYWMKGSAVNALKNINIPLICINALNDPLVPKNTLPDTANKNVVFCRPKYGGHGAFIGSPKNWLGITIGEFFTDISGQ